MKLSALPALLQPLEGGLFAGVCTTPDGTHHAVVLLAEQPAERLTWKKAMNWAAKLGAVLPTRPMGALLFANAKAQFEPEWHWTSESFDSSYAWLQSFIHGTQYGYHKSCEGRARAVRLIQLTP